MSEAKRFGGAALLLCVCISINGIAKEVPRVGAMNIGDNDKDLLFSPLTPCRIVDTRLAGGIMTSAFPRYFFVAGTAGFESQGGKAGGCGVPIGAASALINFVAVGATGGGNLKGAAYGTTIPETGSIINYQALTPPLNIANGLPFPICDTTSGCGPFHMTIQVNGASTHLVADVLGYFKRFPTEQVSNGDITEVIAGEGLNGGGTSGSVTLDADFETSGGFNGTGSKIARADHKHYLRTIIVSPVGTPAQNGADLLAALAGITDNSVTNPYLIKVEPGVYDLGATSLQLKPWVDIEGSGQYATQITKQTASPATATVLGATDCESNCEVRNLNIDATPLTDFAQAVNVAGGFPRFDHVRITAGGGTTNVGIFNDGIAEGWGPELRDAIVEVSSGVTADNYGLWTENVGSVFLRDSSVRVVGGTTSKGIHIGVDSQVTLTQSSVAVRSAQTCYGLFFTANEFIGSEVTFSQIGVLSCSVSEAAVYLDSTAGISVTLRNSRLTASSNSPSTNRGAFVGAGNLELEGSRVRISANAAGVAQGIRLEGGFATINQSIVSATSGQAASRAALSLAAGAFQARIGGSRLDGPILNPDAVPLTCVVSYNTNYVELDSACNPVP